MNHRSSTRDSGSFQRSIAWWKPAFVLCGFFLIGMLSPVHAEDSAIQEQLNQIQSELRTLRSEVRRLQTTLDRLGQPVAAPSKHGVPMVSLDLKRTLGSGSAIVGIVEFSDYQCPYCRQFHTDIFAALRHKYIDSGKVLYSYRDFPLSFHPEAKPAAIATNCAGNQDAYWAMQQRLFENQGRLGRAYYEYLAQHIQLDTEAFKECLNDPEQVRQVENDVNYGTSVGVSGTPHFFIGRLEGDVIVDVKTITGAQPFSVFAQAIDSLLN